MADTFHQIYIHIIFSPKKREALIHPNWEEKLHPYITGIVQQRGHKMLAIGGMSDHLHFFIGQKPNEALSDLVREVKRPAPISSVKITYPLFIFPGRVDVGCFRTAVLRLMRFVSIF